MKAYNKLMKLTQDLLKSLKDSDVPQDDEVTTQIAELEAFLSYDNYYKRKPDMEDAVKVLSDAVNIIGGDNKEEFVKFLSNEHRTLQQGITGLFLAWLESLSKLSERQYDGRNEGSVRVAKQIFGWLQFCNELESYHTDKDKEDDLIRYIEEHKLDMRSFKAIVDAFSNRESSYRVYLPTI